MIFTPSLCRAARGLLGWKQDDLAAASSVHKRTILKFERGLQNPYPRTIRDLVEAFQSAGVVFIASKEGVHDAGVALKWGMTTAKNAEEDTDEKAEGGDEEFSSCSWDEDFKTIDNDGILKEDRALLRLYYEEYPDRWDKLSPLGKACLARTIRL
jgi:transcriptional regulator with XRE-family HTH domain